MIKLLDSTRVNYIYIYFMQGVENSPSSRFSAGRHFAKGDKKFMSTVGRILL